LNGGWLLVPRESQQWIGYAILLAAFLQGFASPRARLFSSAICAVFAIVVTLLPIAQSALGPLGTPVWFLGSLISYLLVRTVLQPEFTAASLRVPVLLCLPLICSAPMLFFGGSAMLAELAVVGAIAAAANYLASHSSPLGAPFAEAALLFYFLLLLNGTLYADLQPALAWLQWVVPALGTLLPKLLLRLPGQLTQQGKELSTIASVTVAQVVVGLIFYFVARPTLPF
jgi:hypothetical protein